MHRNPKITARIVADSIAENCPTSRLTTMEVCFPMIIQSEFNTHRKFSRNSASSRAIPIEKQIKEVEEDTFIPSRLFSAAKGMYSTAELDDYAYVEFQAQYYAAAKNAAKQAREMIKTGVHKQHIAFILKPFMWQRVIVSSTDWDNWFKLRMAEDALPEINDLATAMHTALNESTPKIVTVNDYHIPYDPGTEYSLEERIIVATARCAKISYNMHNRETTVEQATELYNRLRTSGHWSPFEHIARASSFDTFCLGDARNYSYPWAQHRAEIDGGQC